MAQSYTSQRPTLPSLHTLDLPTFTKQVSFDANLSYDSYDHRVSLLFNIWDAPTHRSLQSSRRSWSPTSTSSPPSRTPSLSPPPSEVSSYASSLPRTPSPTISQPCISVQALLPAGYAGPLGGFRLQPSSLDEAHAVIVASPFDEPYSPDSPLSAGVVAGKTRAVLLMGKALEQLRQPQRPFAKGARLHPYRIVARTPAGSRRSSISPQA
jgi:hypothetical protein